MTRDQAAERIAIDPTRCDGVGLCAIQAPDLIELDVWGFPLISDAPLEGRLVKQASRAVSACPKRALYLHSENDEVRLT